MERFWQPLVVPILEKLQPEVVIEVGSLAGENTRHLLRYCQEHNATLHAIDPLPQFDVAAWQAEFGDLFHFHQAKSLEILRDLPAADLVLIDGDHNWYTVYHELKQLAEVAMQAERPFPVVLFHDIGWPYARRDQYYDPNDIPKKFRQRFRQKGIWPGRSGLHKFGINQEVHNAVSEGGPRNGVLTAVEDFVAEAGEPLRLILIDGFNGLGILYPESLAERTPELAAHLGQIELGMAVLGGHIRALDNLFISWIVEVHRHNQRLARAASSVLATEDTAEDEPAAAVET